MRQLTGIALLLAFGSVNAATFTMDFNGAPDENLVDGDTYTEDGFTLTVSGTNSLVNVLDNALRNNQWVSTEVLTFTKDGGGAFQFISFDFLSINGSATDPFTVVGLLSKNQQYSLGPFTTSSMSFSTVAIASMAMVDEIQLIGNIGPGAIRFDNFVFEVIPLPAALPLLSSALAGLGLIGWRRRSS